MYTFADALADAMGDLSQCELAKRSRVDQANIARALDGASPRFETVQKLCGVLPNLAPNIHRVLTQPPKRTKAR